MKSRDPSKGKRSTGGTLRLVGLRRGRSGSCPADQRMKLRADLPQWQTTGPPLHYWFWSARRDVDRRRELRHAPGAVTEYRASAPAPHVQPCLATSGLQIGRAHV